MWPFPTAACLRRTAVGRGDKPRGYTEVGMTRMILHVQLL